MLPESTPPEGGGLYIIWFSDTHFYGGRAKNFQDRWRRHLEFLQRGKHPNRHMQSAFNLHGKFEPKPILFIEVFNEQVSAEQEWLDKNFGTEGCLNLSPSAKGMSGFKHRPESIKKMSDASKGQAISDRHRAAAARVGRETVWDEARRKVHSDACMGRVMTESCREKIRRSLSGRTFTAERLEIHTQAMKGVTKPPGFGDRIAALNRSRRGEKRSEEEKARISLMSKGKIWVCTELRAKRVLPEEVQVYLSEGWQRGKKWRANV